MLLDSARLVFPCPAPWLAQRNPRPGATSPGLDLSGRVPAFQAFHPGASRDTGFPSRVLRRHRSHSQAERQPTWLCKPAAREGTRMFRDLEV